MSRIAGQNIKDIFVMVAPAAFFTMCTRRFPLELTTRQLHCSNLLLSMPINRWLFLSNSWYEELSYPWNTLPLPCCPLPLIRYVPSFWHNDIYGVAVKCVSTCTFHPNAMVYAVRIRHLRVGFGYVPSSETAPRFTLYCCQIAYWQHADNSQRARLWLAPWWFTICLHRKWFRLPQRCTHYGIDYKTWVLTSRASV